MGEKAVFICLWIYQRVAFIAEVLEIHRAFTLPSIHRRLLGDHKRHWRQPTERKTHSHERVEKPCALRLILREEFALLRDEHIDCGSRHQILLLVVPRANL